MHSKMINEGKKKPQKLKSTVAVRSDIKMSVHARLKQYHKTKPRTILLDDTINELIDRGLKSIKR